MQVDDDEERRRAGRVQIADEPSPVDVAHDVLDRGERVRRGRLVVHREEDAGDELQHEHDRRNDAEAVPEVEVLRRVILGGVLLDELRHREARVDPRAERAQATAEPVENVSFGARHLRSSPSRSRSAIVLSLMIAVRRHEQVGRGRNTG